MLSISSFLFALRIEEFLYTEAAEVVLEIISSIFLKLANPILLLAFAHDSGSIIFGAVLPSGIEILPTLRCIRLDNRTLEHQIVVADLILLMRALLLYFCIKANAHFFVGSFAITDTLFPEIIGELTSSLSGIRITYKLANLIFGELNTLDTKRHELSTAHLLACLISFRSGTIVFATYQALHFAGIAADGVAYIHLEKEIRYRSRQFMTNLEGLACFIDIRIEISRFKRLRRQ